MYDSGYTGTLSTDNITINGTAPSAVVNATSGSETSSTLTVNSATVSGSAVTIFLGGLTSPVSVGNYAFSITTSAGDYGANFQYEEKQMWFRLELYYLFLWALLLEMLEILPIPTFVIGGGSFYNHCEHL